MQATASRTRIYRKGPIFREGDDGSTMFVIKSGRVMITKNMYGIMVKIAELGPGDHFGEMSLLEGQPRSATATFSPNDASRSAYRNVARL